MKYETKDSGAREEFKTGSRRDTQVGKPRYDLVPPLALKRIAELYARGAEKYGEYNWEIGQPYSRMIASMMRHLYQFMEGETTEDHLAALVWGALGIMHFEEVGRSYELDDLPLHKHKREEITYHAEVDTGNRL